MVCELEQQTEQNKSPVAIDVKSGGFLILKIPTEYFTDHQNGAGNPLQPTLSRTLEFRTLQGPGQELFTLTYSGYEKLLNSLDTHERESAAKGRDIGLKERSTLAALRESIAEFLRKQGKQPTLQLSCL